MSLAWGTRSRAGAAFLRGMQVAAGAGVRDRFIVSLLSFAFALVGCGARAPRVVSRDGAFVDEDGGPDGGGDGAGSPDGAGGPDGAVTIGAACARLPVQTTSLAQPEYTAPCATMCGDGRIDSCTGRGGPDGGILLTRTEACDGDELAGASCGSLGFAGGAVSCSSCAFDTSRCFACATCGRVRGCEGSALPGEISALDLVETAAGIALVYGDAQGMHLATVADDLKLSVGPTFGAAGVERIALAAMPGGFLVASGQSDGVALQPLDAGGVPVGAARLLPDAALPVLAGRPGGGPLLAFTTPDDAERVQLLAADGRDETAPVTVAPKAIGSDAGGSAVFVGDGFLLAVREDAAGVVVTGVGLDGKLRARSPVRLETEEPHLLWTGSTAWLSYFDFSNGQGPRLARLDGRGAVAGSEVAIDATPGAFSAAALAAIGEDPIVLYGRGAGLELERITPAGTTAVAPFGIYAAPTGVRGWRVGRHGNEAIVAWIGWNDRRLGLARVDLAP